jgi:uncharacterized protein YuzE
MEYDPDSDVYYLVLEDGPSIGVFSKTKWGVLKII